MENNIYPLKISSGKIILNKLTEDKENYMDEQLLLKIMIQETSYSNYRAIHIYWSINEMTKKGFFILTDVNGAKYSKSYVCNNLEELDAKLTSVCGYELLHPIRYTKGWEIKWNHLENINLEEEPDNSDFWITLDEDTSWFEFKIDKDNYYGIDVGYYGSKEDGIYGVKLVKNGDWDMDMPYNIKSRNLIEITRKIEELMIEISDRYLSE